MACEYEKAKEKDRRFLDGVDDRDLFRRREMHERQRAEGDMPGPVGSREYVERLLWMREVRTQIRERRLE